MKRHDAKADLEGRPAEQALEILAMSGPHTDAVMDALKAGDYAFIQDRFQVTVTDEAAKAVIAKYGHMFGTRS